MKKARFILSASMIALMGISAITFSSCSKSDDCAVGYTGSGCKDEIRTPMLGVYLANDANDLTGAPLPAYNATISTNPSVSIVNISNFSGLFSSQNEIVTANVKTDGNNISFTIPSQKPDGMYEVSGSGTFDSQNNQIAISYEVTQPDSLGGQTINYHGTWTKQ